VFKLRYGGERRYTVFFQQGMDEKLRKKIEVSSDQVDVYGTENGNANNIKGVDFIAVEAPSPVLRDGLIIVDTPGVGGLFKKHRDITYRHAPRADAIFFVTDSVESPIGMDEVAFLKDLRRVTGLIYFVQTKASKVDCDARRKRMENNIDILINQIGFRREDIRYFVIDSELKTQADKSRNIEDLEFSGFIPLMTFLNDDLKRRKDINLAAIGLRRAREKFEVIKAETTRKREIVSADTADKRFKLASDNQASVDALNEWTNNIRPALLNEFQQALSADTADIQAALTLELKPGGRVSDNIASQIATSIQENSINAAQMYDLAPALAQNARAHASECVVYLIHELEIKASSLLQALATKAGAQLANQLTLQSPIKTFAETGNSPLSALRANPVDSDWFIKIRAGMYGGMAGVAIAGVVGGVIGSVFPVVGTIIGSHIGIMIAGAWGAKKALDIQDSQTLTSTQHRLQGAIDKELGNILVQAQAEFTKASRMIDAIATESFRQIISQSQQRLADQKKSIQAREKSTAELLQKEEKIIQALEKEVAEIEKQLSATEASFRL